MKKRLYFLFTVNLIMSNLNAQTGFTILPMTSILELVNDSRLIKIDSFTMAKVYKGINDRYYLTPAVGPKGIEAEDIIVIDSILASKHIPIEETNPNIFQINQNTIENIQSEAKILVLNFLTENGLSTSFVKDDLDIEKLNKIINKEKGILRYEKYLFPLGILIGEIIRRAEGGSWVLDKRFSYNPYYIPLIISTDKRLELDPWFKLGRALSSRYQVDLNELFNIMRVRAKVEYN